MAIYVYSALNKEGKKISSTIVAENREAALHALKKKDLFIVDLEAIVLEKKKRSIRGKKKVFLVSFTRQFGGLLKIGYTVDQALGIIQKQIPSSLFRNIVDEIKKLVQKGDSLSSSLEEFPRIFPSYYVQIVHVGEATGTLDELFESLLEYLSRKNEITEHVRNILIYPCIVLCTGIGVVGFLLGYVVPVLSSLFMEFEVPLPLITSVFFSISKSFFSLSS